MKRKVLLFIYFFIGTWAIAIPVTNGLVGYWAGEGNAYDQSGIGNHGTLIGGTTYETGRVGSAFRFDGVDDSVEIANSPSLDILGDITMSAWIKPDSASRGLFIAKGNGNDYVDAYQFRYGNSNDQRLLLAVSQGGTSGSYLSGNALIPIGVFTHVVARIQGTVASIYVNGVLDSTGTITSNRYSDGGTLRLGRRGDDSCIFAGLVDEVAIYNRSLSLSEIQTLYNSPGMVPEPGSLCLYLFSIVLMLLYKAGKK